MNDAQSQTLSAIDQDGSAGRRKPVFHFWQCFWLSFLVVSLAYAWYCFYVPPNSVVWADGYDVAQTQAARSGKPVVVFFTGKWCVPCRIMKRKVWGDSQVAAVLNEFFHPVMIDADDPNSLTKMNRYRVGSLPNTTVIDSQGNLLQQRQGGMGKAEFLELLEASRSTIADGV